MSRGNQSPGRKRRFRAAQLPPQDAPLPRLPPLSAGGATDAAARSLGQRSASAEAGPCAPGVERLRHETLCAGHAVGVTAVSRAARRPRSVTRHQVASADVGHADTALQLHDLPHPPPHPRLRPEPVRSKYPRRSQWSRARRNPAASVPNSSASTRRVLGLSSANARRRAVNILNRPPQLPAAEPSAICKDRRAVGAKRRPNAQNMITMRPIRPSATTIHVTSPPRAIW